MATPEVNKILKRYGNDATDIIAILQDVQQTYRYLPQDVMSHLSEKLDIPLTRIYHLSTFFRAFSLEPRGKHHIQVCMGTACHVRGSPRILDAVERKLRISAGRTTKDLNYSLETVNCVGACALGPLVVVDGKAVGKMTGQKADRLVASLQEVEAGKPRPPAEKAAKAPEKPAETAEKLTRAQPKKAKPARPARAKARHKVRAGKPKAAAARKSKAATRGKPLSPKRGGSKKTAKGAQKKAR
jgi:NADH-quinone oxidoreductase subunit E